MWADTPTRSPPKSATRASWAVLPTAFVNENFEFGKRFTGATEQQPRWKRCLAEADNGLGEMLGQAYVEKAFTPASKARTDEMVRNLRAALGERIRQLSWMSEATKQQALGKLEAFQQKIGYPQSWRDYSALQVRNGSFAENVMAATYGATKATPLESIFRLPRLKGFTSLARSCATA